MNQNQMEPKAPPPTFPTWAPPRIAGKEPPPVLGVIVKPAPFVKYASISEKAAMLVFQHPPPFKAPPAFPPDVTPRASSQGFVVK